MAPLRCIFDVPWSEVPLELLKTTGLRPIDPEQEDSPIHCRVEYHFARFSGPGSTLVPLIYPLSFSLAKRTGNFKMSAESVVAFLGRTRRGDVYKAFELLELAGFFELIRERDGQPTMYRPVPHAEWKKKHPGFCTQKQETWAHLQDDPLREFGRLLYGITGEKWFNNVLLGIRTDGRGMTDQDILEFAKAWVITDGQQTGLAGGIHRRKRFIDALRKHAGQAKSTDDLLRKPLHGGVAETATGAA